MPLNSIFFQSVKLSNSLYLSSLKRLKNEKSIVRDGFYMQSGNDWHLSQSNTDTDEEIEADVLLAEPELKKPPMYAVIMHNDDYTPMEFVVQVLQQMFGHSYEKAMDIMLDVHNNGTGVAGIYPRDIAETKAQMVNREARVAGHPLLTQIEPVSD